MVALIVCELGHLFNFHKKTIEKNQSHVNQSYISIILTAAHPGSFSKRVHVFYYNFFFPDILICLFPCPWVSYKWSM